MVASTQRRNNGRALAEDDMPMALNADDMQTKVRVKLCLKNNHEHCGEYTEAKSEYMG